MRNCQMHVVQSDKCLSNCFIIITTAGFVCADIVFLTPLLLDKLRYSTFVLSVCIGLFTPHQQCDARLDGYNYTHSRHRQECMKVGKIHFSPHDSLNAATFQGFRLCELKAFLVTCLGSNATKIVYNQNNTTTCWISCCGYVSQFALFSLKSQPAAGPFKKSK